MNMHSKRNGLFAVAGGLLLAAAISAQSGFFATMTIDGDYSDWASVPVLDSDLADNVGSVDIATTQIANDANYLYIRNTYHGTVSQPTYIALDVDQNTATGFDVFGMGLAGSEAGWQNDFPFTQAAGVFNDGQGMSGEFFGSGAALLVTSGDNSARELAISLDILFNSDSSPVFADDTFTLLLYTDVGGNDVSAPIPYTLAIPEPTSALLAGLGAWLLILIRRRR
jgi:hypothetical protein